MQAQKAYQLHLLHRNSLIRNSPYQFKTCVGFLPSQSSVIRWNLTAVIMQCWHRLQTSDAVICCPFFDYHTFYNSKNQEQGILTNFMLTNFKVLSNLISWIQWTIFRAAMFSFPGTEQTVHCFMSVWEPLLWGTLYHFKEPSEAHVCLWAHKARRAAHLYAPDTCVN